MELLYAAEHTSCLNYDGGQSPLIEIKHMPLGQVWETSIIENGIFFITEGQLKFSCGDIKEDILSKGKMVLLPSGTRLSILAEKDTSVTVFRLRSHIQLCDRYSLEQLLKEKVINKVEEQNYLDINEVIWKYLDMLHRYIASGLKCILFFEIKLKELLYILRAYYTKKELLVLFRPLLTNDTRFSDFILRYHHKAKTVKELASLTHYSVSGFEKRFKKAFNVSPAQWLTQQKAKNIFHEINCNMKTLKEISLEYDFASPAHLNKFCKLHFGMTPGRIRKQNSSKTEKG